MITFQGYWCIGYWVIQSEKNHKGYCVYSLTMERGKQNQTSCPFRWQRKHAGEQGGLGILYQASSLQLWNFSRAEQPPLGTALDNRAAACSTILPTLCDAAHSHLGSFPQEWGIHMHGILLQQRLSNLQLPLLLFSELFKSIIAFLRPEPCTAEVAAVLWIVILANSWHRNERVHRGLYYTQKYKVKILSINLNTAIKPWARLWGLIWDVMEPERWAPGGCSCCTTRLDHETLVTSRWKLMIFLLPVTAHHSIICTQLPEIHMFFDKKILICVQGLQMSSLTF